MAKELEKQPNNPLHGIRLVDVLDYLINEYGFQELGRRINIRCFTNNPTLKSSLTFLRKTPWAREKVEELYIKTKHRNRNKEDY
ncbi:VF530 family protein [Cyclobacterium sp. 1_MG-2023]|uniref:VF530 family protein n=1 Tax=Cyclobacterium sp. 1_MG-2023 TaxID=3062681 RepID=UPI0026E48F5C|nr:VF530 family protein [Cyclobacterium sp. 1_MG-2023]MDO6436523.1 VF530 family protein [Cyclobacterium sp. 1_MG-2023]